MIHENEPSYWGILLQKGVEHYALATGYRTLPDNALELINIKGGGPEVVARYEAGEWIKIMPGASLVDAMLNLDEGKTPRWSFTAGKITFADSTRMVVNAITQVRYAVED